MNRNKKTAKRAMGMALAAVLLLSPLSYLGAETAYAATTYYNQKTEKTVTRGVTYEKSSRMTDAGIQNIHVLKVDLTESTIAANTRFFEREEDVPRQAISMGMQAITQARKILLIASGADKADAIYASCFGPVTPGIPASILQLHQDVTVIADKDALSKCPQQAWAQKAPSKEIHTGFLFR